MGFQALFYSDSDLSGISEALNPTTMKKIDVVHQSEIEVNESGTKAAAFTGNLIWSTKLKYFRFHHKPFSLVGLFGSDVVGYSFTFEFIADHPFLYYLVDLENDAIPLFVGRLVDPLSN